MSRLLCCLCARTADMGAALSLSHPQEGENCDGAGLAVAPPTMADVIRERKKKAGGAALGTLRRRIAAAARRPRDARPDRGCEHARFIRSLVSSWRLAEVFVVCEQLEAAAALRDLVTQAELAREPAQPLHMDLADALTHRWWCDVELAGAGFAVSAHRALLAARSAYFRDLLAKHPAGTWRVPLEGAGAALSRAELEAALLALYAGAAAPRAATRGTGGSALCDLCPNWDRGSDGNLDIINVDNTSTWRSAGGGRGAGGGGGGACGCARGRDSAPALRRLAAALGFSPDTLHADMRYLLDSGEYADSRLVFRVDTGAGGGSGAGGGAQYGFRTALDLPCHRVVLAARSRFFRSVMSRRNSSGNSSNMGNVSNVCVDEKVLPRRFARALLHAAYTDQVDLSLIGRNSTSPSSTNSTGTGGSTGWAGMGRGAARVSTAALDDAFQLYEIARFLEMPIVVQGCEDCIVEALSPDTLPHVLRWAAAPHASQWVHRQAMRYLTDEFPTIMSAAAAARLPRAALAAALASPFLQASEAQALRALLRWGALKHQLRESPPLCGVAGGGAAGGAVAGGGAGSARRGARRRDVSDAALRAALAELVALVRLEHLPPNNDLLQQAIRRGIVDSSATSSECSLVDAWLGRGASRPPRCFLPHLDELKALLDRQPAPAHELARLRRPLTMPIPDTLYMVAAAHGSPGAAGSTAGAVGGGELSCVSPRAAAALRARYRELCAAPAAVRARALHAPHDAPRVLRQIALRAVREMSLPDACAELLLADDSDDADTERERERDGSSDNEWERARDPCCDPTECCSKPSPSLHIPMDGSRSGTCRRELPSRPDSTQHRSWRADYRDSRESRPWQGRGATTGGARPAGGGTGGRLSAAVPDVAMAPNANTHLLTARDYCRPPPPPPAAPPLLAPPPRARATHDLHIPDYGPAAVLQLDLGDGATHTPRPGSRAMRAAHSAERARHHREHQMAACLQSAGVAGAAARTRADDELRAAAAALELSVIRAYSSLGGRTLPHSFRADLPTPHHAHVRSRASPSPGGAGGASSSASQHGDMTRRSRDDGVVCVGGVGGVGGGVGEAEGGGSPRRGRRDSHYRHDYRLESPRPASRGASPNDYA